MPHASRFTLFVLCAALGGTLSAQAPNDVRITEVRFSKDRPRLGGDGWLVMAVRLEVRGVSDRSAPNRQFLDDIQLFVSMAHNMGTPSNPQLEYYWSEVEAPTLERGSHTFRFYLSPEQIKRGRMGSGEPYAWFVQATHRKNGLPLQNAIAVSQNLRSQERLDRFKQLLDEQKDARAGILLPQKETPFNDMYITETPTIRGHQRGER